MIRSTQLTLKFSNKNKVDKINLFLDEYKKLTQFFIDYLWDNFAIQQKIPTLIPKEITKQASTWLSARMIQASAKQASGIVRGTRRKHEKRLYQLNKLQENNELRRARKLYNIIKNNPINKPNLDSIESELDERFVKFEIKNETTFDSWLILTCIGNKLKIKIPIKFHKHYNLLNKEGTQLKGIRLSKNKVNISFDINKKEKTTGKTVGIDVGMRVPFTVSDKQYSEDSLNGHTIETVCKRISRKQKGSIGFKKACVHRKNLINYYKNKIDWQNIKVIKIENIKNLRYKKRTSRYLSSFVYREYFEQLKQKAEILGVQVSEVCSTYTSQRCSCCGWTRKKNRNKDKFKCSMCGYAANADFNASVNISLDLVPVSTKERLKKKNISGFYWNTFSGQEPIVPVVQKL